MTCWLGSGRRWSIVARAPQRAVDRRLCGRERLCGLPGGEAEDIAQNQGGALAARQVLQRRDERQLQRLASFVARLGPRGAVGDAERLVRVGLDPHPRGQAPGALAQLLPGWRTVVDRQHPLGTARNRVNADVGRDPVQPGAHRASTAEARIRPPGPKQRLLERVVGVIRRAEHPVAVRVQVGAASLHELVERGALHARRHATPQAVRAIHTSHAHQHLRPGREREMTATRSIPDAPTV